MDKQLYFSKLTIIRYFQLKNMIIYDFRCAISKCNWTVCHKKAETEPEILKSVNDVNDVNEDENMLSLQLEDGCEDNNLTGVRNLIIRKLYGILRYLLRSIIVLTVVL